jgi:hypothetical protein
MRVQPGKREDRRDMLERRMEDLIATFPRDGMAIAQRISEVLFGVVLDRRRLDV